MKKSLALFLCIFLIGFLIFSPAVISGGIGKNIYRMKEAELAEDYRGTIEFWHVVSFKTPSGSGYDYLKKRCVQFERNTPYVFIELKGMTVEEAKRRMSQGERPDIISFPMGAFDESDMIGIAEPKNQILCMKELSRKALPYMMDSYVLVMNRTLLREIGVQTGFSTELSEEMFSDAYQRLTDAGIIPIAGTETEGLNPQEAMENPVLVSDTSYISDAELPQDVRVQIGKSLFSESRSGMYLCPYSEFTAMKNEGMEFETEIYACTDYSDIVQMLGVYESGDDRKNEMLRRLAEGYFTETMQRRLEGVCMLPCTLIEEIYLSDSERLDSYRRICEKAVK